VHGKSIIPGMFTMAVGHSDDVDPARAIEEAISQCREQLELHAGGARPSAALLFCTLDSFDAELVTHVRKAFGQIEVIGATSAAEMSSTAGYLEDSIALAVFASDNVELAVGMGVRVDVDPVRAAQTAAAQALAGLAAEPKVCIALTEGVNAQRAIEALRAALPAGVLIIGGAAGRNELAGTAMTYQVCNETISDAGIAIMLMAGPLDFSTAVGMGWRVLGPRGVVTASDYGVIRMIDARPAVDWASAYLDTNSTRMSGNPLAIQDAGSDDWYLRVVLSADLEGGLRIPGSVPVGATVQLTTTSPDDMLEATHDAVQRALAAYSGGGEPSAALIFSCQVRKYLLGTRTAKEVQMAQALLSPSMSIAGMYCMGEVAPTGANGDSHLLNETFVTLLLGS
jgi:hypothetical protein